MPKGRPPKTGSFPVPQVASASPITAPPRAAFLQLLRDSEDETGLRRLLRMYSDPAQQRLLLRILQDAKYSHELRTTLASQVSKHRSWFTKRDRCRGRVARLDQELEALLVEFRDSVYPLLRASNRLPNGYARDTADLFAAIEQLQRLTASNPLLARSFTTRGHQAQPYLTDAVKAMRKLGLTKADAQDLLVLIGVKHDSLAD